MDQIEGGVSGAAAGARCICQCTMHEGAALRRALQRVLLYTSGGHGLARHTAKQRGESCGVGHSSSTDSVRSMTMADAPPPPAAWELVQAGQRVGWAGRRHGVLRQWQPGPAVGVPSSAAAGRTVADGGHAHAPALAPQHIQQCDDEPRAAGADGVPDGHRAAKHIHPAGGRGPGGKWQRAAI